MSQGDGLGLLNFFQGAFPCPSRLDRQQANQKESNQQIAAYFQFLSFVNLVDVTISPANRKNPNKTRRVVYFYISLILLT